MGSVAVLGMVIWAYRKANLQLQPAHTVSHADYRLGDLKLVQ
jgi:hypothetical protein